MYYEILQLEKVRKFTWLKFNDSISVDLQKMSELL